MLSGRPSGFCKEIADEICDQMSCSEKSIRRLCKENPHWPDRLTIYRWTVKYPEFYHQYLRAKQAQVDWMVDEALEIAEDGSNDTVTTDKGQEKCDNEWVARSRLRVDTIKWYASKLAPKLYGDRMHHEHKLNSQEGFIDYKAPKLESENEPK